MLEIDHVTGSFKAAFDVSIEDNNLVFRPTRILDSGCCGAKVVERYGVAEEFLGLVANKHEGCRYRFGFELPLFLQHERQYTLVDEVDQGLLRLARRMGPLFGDDLSDTGTRFARGAIREPVAWWIAAAGCLRFAANCASVVDGEAAASNLDDEIIATASLFARNGRRGMLVTTMYSPDQGFPGDYGVMLGSSPAGRRHALLSEYGKSGDRDTLVASGYGSSTIYHEACREVVSGVDGTRVTYDRASPLDESAIDAIVDLTANCSAVGEPPSVELVTAEPSKTEGSLYVIRYMAKSNPNNLMGLSNPYINPRELDSAVGLTMSIPNGTTLGADQWKIMYEDMYNALVKLHTNRSAPDLSKGMDANPFYANLLERIWCTFARMRAGRTIRVCPQCFKAFAADNKRQFCSDTCRANFNKKRARDKVALKAELIDEFLLATMKPNNCYSEKGLCHMFNEGNGSQITPEQVKKRLNQLLKDGKVYRSPGQGRVWRVIS